jgi:hypothetical protein
MAAKRRSTYPNAKGRTSSIPRLRLALSLTAGEVRKLKALAAKDMRPMGQFVAGLVSDHLAKKRRKAPALAASRRPRRFEVAVRIPKDELTRLGELAEPDGRSLSGYVTLIVLAKIGGA